MSSPQNQIRHPHFLSKDSKEESDNMFFELDTLTMTDYSSKYKNLVN